MIKSIIRAGLLNGFLPTYEAILQKVISKDLRLLTRNSALSAQDYSPLLSDLDLTATGTFSDEQLRRLREIHEKTRKAFPILGELEIYSESDWQERNQLLLGLEPFYTPLRLLRKLRWMLRAIENSNALAGLRAKRGLNKALVKLGVRGELNDLKHGRIEVVEPAFEKLAAQMVELWKIDTHINSDEFEFYHPQLELTFTNKSPSEGAFVVTSSLCAYLMAAVFPMRVYSGLNQEVLDRIRTNPELLAFVRKFAKCELMIMTASVIGFPTLPDWYEGNRNELQTWL